MDTEKLKAAVVDELNTHRHQLSELSRQIHSNPELGFQEVKAVALLTGYLEKQGFSVERNVCDLPTAFKARYGQGKPAMALMAEYDALPDIGHACGHNLIAASAVGAAVASRPGVDQLGGSVLVIGTPAEELYGGKAIMAEKGAFGDLDAAMIVHGETHSAAMVKSLACQTLDIEFFGKAAHAALSPEEGINALEAMILSFNAINSLRQHLVDSARIHGIITSGGEAANIVPAYSAGNFIVRAEDDAYLDELKQKVLNCFAGAATTTGARLEYKWGDVRYAPMLNNLILAKLFWKNLMSLGLRNNLSASPQHFGSTDMGNVSQIVPSIHPTVAIASPEVLLHTPQFAAVAASETAIERMLDAAKALAMTIVDLLASPEMVAKVKKEFARAK